VVYHLGSGATLSQLTWYNRGGQEVAKVGEPGIMANPKLSPDAQRVAVDVADAKDRNVDVWIRDLPDHAFTRFTFDPAEETNGVWSRDGRTIAYRSAQSAGCVIRLKKANGLEAEHGVGPVRGRADSMPNSWTGDDAGVVITQQSASSSKLLLLTLADGKETPIVSGSGNQYGGQISPDGKWLAYASDESGDWEVYITPFPGTGGKLQVSRGGGTEPRWRGDGKEIFYLSPSEQIISVAVSGAGGLSTGMPAPLFQVHPRAPVSSSDIFSYDVTADGQRFLVNQYAKPAEIPPLNIVLNSTAGMQ
jgi:eukaryotic-like serine/threonine-protein kinase